ncbi:uncharacterized protein LOC120341105 [Styela clava]
MGIACCKCTDGDNDETINKKRKMTKTQRRRWLRRRKTDGEIFQSTEPTRESLDAEKRETGQIAFKKQQLSLNGTFGRRNTLKPLRIYLGNRLHETQRVWETKLLWASDLRSNYTALLLRGLVLSSRRTRHVTRVNGLMSSVNVVNTTNKKCIESFSTKVSKFQSTKCNPMQQFDPLRNGNFTGVISMRKTLRNYLKQTRMTWEQSSLLWASSVKVNPGRCMKIVQSIVRFTFEASPMSLKAGKLISAIPIGHMRSAKLANDESKPKKEIVSSSDLTALKTLGCKRDETLVQSRNYQENRFHQTMEIAKLKQQNERTKIKIKRQIQERHEMAQDRSHRFTNPKTPCFVNCEVNKSAIHSSPTNVRSASNEVKRESKCFPGENDVRPRLGFVRFKEKNKKRMETIRRRREELEERVRQMDEDLRISKMKLERSNSENTVKHHQTEVGDSRNRECRNSQQCFPP